MEKMTPHTTPQVGLVNDREYTNAVEANSHFQLQLQLQDQHWWQRSPWTTLPPNNKDGC